MTNGRGYQVITFPDGEKHLKIEKLDLKDDVEIICRIRNSDDLFILMQLSDILNRQCVKVYKVHITYLMSMRCDRLFSFEEPFTLKIVADVINSFHARTVTVLEPHSERTRDLINNCLAIYNIPTEKKGVCLAFPDDGAAKRYIANEADILCKKHRDPSTGKLSGFSISSKGDYKEGDIINVVDDLCDGGGTFCGIAPLLRELKPKELNLTVTHAVQEEGILKVAKVYDNVYITNSYSNWDSFKLPDNVHVEKRNG